MPATVNSCSSMVGPASSSFACDSAANVAISPSPSARTFPRACRETSTSHCLRALKRSRVTVTASISSRCSPSRSAFSVDSEPRGIHTTRSFSASWTKKALRLLTHAKDTSKAMSATDGPDTLSISIGSLLSLRMKSNTRDVDLAGHEFGEQGVTQKREFPVFNHIGNNLVDNRLHQFCLLL